MLTWADLSQKFTSWFYFRYEERFGNHELPWKKWHIYIEKEEKGDDGVKKRRKKITFQSIVRRIMVGRSIKQGIEGSMRGKMLMKADLVQPKPDFVVY